MKYSLSKIANELGVSKATVSFVLNGKAREARISEAVEKEILDFCKSVHYVPNIHARKMTGKLISNIGFLVSRTVHVDADNPFSDYNINSILGGMIIEAEKHNCRVSVQMYQKDMDEAKVFDWLRSKEIDGLVCYGIALPDNWIEVFKEENRCAVGIGIEPNPAVSSVNIDNFQASYDLAKYALSRGKRRFMYLSGIEGSFVSDERQRGFLACMRENHIDMEAVQIHSAKFSEKQAEKLIRGINLADTDAILCANDDMAIGAILALQEKNIKIPEQIAVGGGDNIVTGRYITPGLTTFDNKQFELGTAAAQSVIRMIHGNTPENIVIPTSLHIRNSL